MDSRVRGHPISFPQPHGMQTWRPRPILVNPAPGACDCGNQILSSDTLPQNPTFRSVGLTQLTRPPSVGSLSIMQLRNLVQNLVQEEFFSTAQQLFSGTPDPPIQFCGPNPMMSQQPISAAPPLGGHNYSGQLAHQGLNSPAPPLLRPPPPLSRPPGRWRLPHQQAQSQDHVTSLALPVSSARGSSDSSHEHSDVTSDSIRLETRNIRVAFSQWFPFGSDLWEIMLETGQEKYWGLPSVYRLRTVLGRDKIFPAELWQAMLKHREAIICDVCRPESAEEVHMFDYPLLSIQELTFKYFIRTFPKDGRELLHRTPVQHLLGQLALIVDASERLDGWEIHDITSSQGPASMIVAARIRLRHRDFSYVPAVLRAHWAHNTKEHCIPAMFSEDMIRPSAWYESDGIPGTSYFPSLGFYARATVPGTYVYQLPLSPNINAEAHACLATASKFGGYGSERPFFVSGIAHVRQTAHLVIPHGGVFADSACNHFVDMVRNRGDGRFKIRASIAELCMAGIFMVG